MVNHSVASTSSTSTISDKAIKKVNSSRRLIIAGLLVLLLSAPVIKVTLLPPAAGFDGYNYSSFRHVANDPERSNGPGPGDVFPVEFDIYDLSGNPVNISSLWSDKPLVLEFGSVSCPIFHGNGPSMEGLYRKYDKGSAEKARIGLLYVREAHPGWFQSSHSSMSDKLANADKLKKKGLSRTIWVDSLNGQLHQVLDPQPNSVYIINTDGTIIYKSAWNAPAEVDRVLDNLINQQKIPGTDESNFCQNPAEYYPMRDMLAYIGRIVAVGGPDALADFTINQLIAGNDDSSNPQCKVEL